MRRDGHEVTVAAPPHVVNLERGYLQLTGVDSTTVRETVLDHAVATRMTTRLGAFPGPLTSLPRLRPAAWRTSASPAYGIASRDLPLIVPADFAFLVMGCTIAVALDERRAQPREDN
jgi:hypothetical protein